MEPTPNTVLQPARPALKPGTMECPQCGAPVEIPAYADGAVCSFCGSTLTKTGQPSAAPAKQGETQRLRSVQCSQCAGPLDAFEGRRILVCAHCGTRFSVLEQGGFTRWHFPCRVTRLQAAEAAARWLADYPGVQEAARTARLTQARLIYAPIWEYKTFVAGWEFGYKLQPRNVFVESKTPSVFGAVGDHLELDMVKEEVKQPYLQERRFFLEATDFMAFGAMRPRMTGRELLLPMLAGEIEPNASVLQPTADKQAFVQKGRDSCLVPMSGAHDSDSHLFSLRESTALLYYPIWVLGYERDNRVSRVVVNGRDAGVNAAVAPASARKQVALLAAQLVFLAILAIVFVLLAVAWSHGRSSMVALAVIVSAAAAVLVWRFRPEHEVEYHEPFSS